MLNMNFTHTPRQAFTQGLLKGLGAPYLLYAQVDWQARAVIAPITLPSHTTAQALRTDWQKIGMDMQSVITHYDQTATPR